MGNDGAKQIVIAHGVNDAWQDVDQNRTNGPAEFASNLRYAVREAMKMSGRQVLLVQPHRVCSFDLLSWLAPRLPHPDALLAPYANAVARVGNEMKAEFSGRVEVAHLFSVPTRCDGDHRKSDMPDGLHATQAYSNKLAAVIRDAMNRLMTGAPTPLPTLTLMRAPLNASNKLEPVPGKDFQTLIVGRPHVTNWSTTDATAVSYQCRSDDPNGFNGGGPLAELVQAGYSTIVNNWPVPASCMWTVTGHAGTVTYPDTYTTTPVPDAQKPVITVTRSPMPLVAGKPFHTTWKAERAFSLTRYCTAQGTGLSAPNAAVALTSGVPIAGSPDVDEPVNEVAAAAWIGYPTTCTWSASGAGGTTTYTETFHTVTR
ncbi:hypothetical protein ASD88_25320 [Pelomonas sp. Root662]|nr:hypothetical protein ASC81_25370 [Pelomonas sp. Root405]KRA76085.1 hypothetical protein ASD88_25320 [Pelomonas sp. Root662]